jgi:hypothetical protein
MMGKRNPPIPPASPTMPLMVPMFVRVIVADVLEHAGLAKGPGNAQREHQNREQIDIEADM